MKGFGMAVWARAAVVTCLMMIAASVASAAPSQGPVRKLVLDEQRIEGKIRRPQMVLIKADQRPAFDPVVATSANTEQSITRGVSDAVVEACAYRGPFSFVNKRVVYSAP